MKRDREQKGSVVRIGDYWCVRYADWVTQDGQRTRKQGLTRKLTPVLPEHRRLKRAPDYVADLQKEFMERINGSRNAPERCATIAQFVQEVWLPFVENRLASSTVTVYRFYWEHILKPRFGNDVLRDFDIGRGQLLMDEIARQSPSMRDATLKKLKSILSAIFKRAIKLKTYSGANPIRDVELADAPEAQETYAYNMEEIRRILALVPDETSKVIIALAAYAGLSKSEIQGLVWESYNGADIAVLSSVVNGKRGKTKTKARKACVPVIAPLRKMLDFYRLRVGNPESGVMFPTKNGTPLSLHNVFYDHVEPALEVCAECHEGKADHDTADHEYSRDSSLPQWHGWHAFRRGLATNLHDLGVHDLTIQRILRHSSVLTTQKAYIKTREQQVLDGMAQLEAEVAKSEMVQ